MYNVYVLRLKNDSRYVGRTDNLKRRIQEHLSGKVRSTRKRDPQLIYYEVYKNKQDAIDRELYLKAGDGRQELEKQLKHTLRASSSSG